MNTLLSLLGYPILLAHAIKPLDLLEPLPDGTTQISFGNHPLSVLDAYLQPFIPWLIGVCAGIAVLMIILGGFQIMLGGGGDIKNSAGSKRILSALLGLLILLFSAVILNWLNASFFILP